MDYRELKEAIQSGPITVDVEYYTTHSVVDDMSEYVDPTSITIEVNAVFTDDHGTWLVGTEVFTQYDEDDEDEYYGDEVTITERSTISIFRL